MKTIEYSVEKKPSELRMTEIDFIQNQIMGKTEAHGFSVGGRETDAHLKTLSSVMNTLPQVESKKDKTAKGIREANNARRGGNNMISRKVYPMKSPF